MALWKVECTGDVREVYQVEAETEDEAMAGWAEGRLVNSEADSVEPVSATKLED